MALATWVDCAITALRPSVVLLASDVLPACALFLRACRHYGIKHCFQERSPCGGIWFEPHGYFADSSLWHEWPACKSKTTENHRSSGKRESNLLVANPAGFRKIEYKKLVKIKKRKDQKIFLLLLDNVTFTGWHPKGIPGQKKNYPLYDNPDEAIRHVSTIVQAIGGKLIIKRHPACCVFTKQRPDTLPANVEYYDGPVEKILQCADVILTFVSKTAFAALAMGKPVVTLAQNPIAVSGSTYHPNTSNDVEQALRNAANKRELDRKLDKFTPFLGWIADEYYYSYTSNPPVFPDLAEKCGHCHAVKGPKKLLERILNDIDSKEVITKEKLASHINYLRYLTGQDVAEPGCQQIEHVESRLKLISRCAERVAIYGAGKFTRKLFMETDAETFFIRNNTDFKVFDDNPGNKDLDSFKVYNSSALPAYLKKPGSIVILATDTWQEPMRAKLRETGIEDSKIIDLFEE